MRSLRSWKRFIILIGLISAVALFLSREYLLQQIGRFLLIEQNPEKADVVMVLNGRDTERSLAVVDLYNKGYANLIVLARGPKQSGSDEFWKRVGKKWNSKIFFQRAIEAMGIPDTCFKIIGGGASSTYDEAKVAKRFVNQNGYKSILLVTSKWHSKRAYLTFRSVFDKDTEIKKRITIYPSKYDTFDPDNWWKTGADAELVFGEYVRLIYYIVMLRISLFHII